jgi:hypothetical protein
MNLLASTQPTEDTEMYAIRDIVKRVQVVLQEELNF